MGNTQKNSPNSTSPIIRTRSRLAIVLVLLLMVVIVGIVASVALLAGAFWWERKRSRRDRAAAGIEHGDALAAGQWGVSLEIPVPHIG